MPRTICIYKFLQVWCLHVRLPLMPQPPIPYRPQLGLWFRNNHSLLWSFRTSVRGERSQPPSVITEIMSMKSLATNTPRALKYLTVSLLSWKEQAAAAVPPYEFIFSQLSQLTPMQSALWNTDLKAIAWRRCEKNKPRGGNSGQASLCVLTWVVLVELWPCPGPTPWVQLPPPHSCFSIHNS